MKLSISMTRRETILGWAYLFINLFVLPVLLDMGNALLAAPLSETQLNLVYFALNFLLVLAIFHRFLRCSLTLALKSPWRCLRFAAAAFVLYYLAMMVISQGILYVQPEFVNVNDSAIMDMTGEQYTLMSVATVFLVPVTEETLYRGLLFRGLHEKSRLLAYSVSTIVFSGIHVISYVGLYDWVTLLLCFVQYLPAGLALAWAYEKADTIVAPILVHITVNQIGISAMR